MLGNYTPDHWVILEFVTDEGIFQKVFAGWKSDHKDSGNPILSTSIISMVKLAAHYRFITQNDRHYICYKNVEGMNKQMSIILDGWKKQNIDVKLLKENEYRNIQ